MIRVGKRIQTLALFCILHTPIWVHADDLTLQMKKAHESFASLQPYLASSRLFQAEANKDVVYELVRDLKDNFHTIESIKTSLRSEPGFKANLQITSDLLRDATFRLSEGNSSYALWRLRGVSNNCISCHAQFKIGMTYEKDEQLPILNDFEKAEFYLATRQLEKARDAYHRAILDPELEPVRMMALRKLLVILVRFSPSPTTAIETLTKIKSAVPLPTADTAEVDSWIKSLGKWNLKSEKKLTPVKQAQILVQNALDSEDIFNAGVDEVSLLRATALLHTALSTKSGVGAERSKAIYLLGYSYSKLPFFFIEELAEIYLQQCILEFPGSSDAKSAFNAYKEKVELDFTGSGGTTIPSDILTRLKELHDIAYGIPPSFAKVQND